MAGILLLCLAVAIAATAIRCERLEWRFALVALAVAVLLAAVGVA